MSSPMPDVIVLLPGITGSVLRKDGKVVWGFSGRSLAGMLFSRGGSMSRALSLTQDPHDVDDLQDGVSADSLIQDLHLLPGLWKIDGYSKVSESIRARFDVTTGENFFEFPYDWRRDNRVSARKLQRDSHSWLKRWRERSGNADAKLILVAHSMGGLVSRYFMDVLGGWKDTRALITFGTPFRGSVNALDTLANGMKKARGFIDLSDMARTFTSIYQLLPVYPAYDAGDGQAQRVGEAINVPNVDPAKAADALAFHNEIFDAGQAARNHPGWGEHGYGLYPIVGTEQETNQFGVRDGDGVTIQQTHLGKDIGGDGTVPRVSAVPRELNDTKGDMYAATKHGSLQNADAVLAHIDGRINDFYLDLGEFMGPPQTGVKLSLQLDDLGFSSHPIDVRVRASEPGAELTADLFTDDPAQPVQRLTLSSGDGEWVAAAFEPVAAGAYRVRVSATGADMPVEDAIAVGDETAEEE